MIVGAEEGRGGFQPAAWRGWRLRPFGGRGGARRSLAARTAVGPHVKRLGR